MAYERVPGDSVPTRTAVGCAPWDGARGHSRRWPVQAMDAFPAMARGCLIRTRWRSGRVNHRAESGAGRSSHGLLVPAQRRAHQPRRRLDREHLSRHHQRSKSRRSRSPERRRAACACWAAPPRRGVTTCRMGWRPRAVPGMASEGVSFGAVGRDDGRMRCPRHRPRALPAIPFPPRRRPDACPVMAPEGLSCDRLPTQWMPSP